VCRNTKYILQNPTPKISQPTIQLAISQLFQKLKNRSTNKYTKYIFSRAFLFQFFVTFFINFREIKNWMAPKAIPSFSLLEPSPKANKKYRKARNK
jgi:hypothetical protein